MNYNINVGYGKLLASKINAKQAGKSFVVGASAVAYRDTYSDIFSADPTGTNRFFNTIDAAVGSCTANAGDTIYVLPGHTESISNATSLLLDVAGVNIVGIGVGANRPTLTYTTAATANIPVSAANVSIENVVFVANFADITSAFTLATAPGFSLVNCEFRDTSSILNFITAVTTTVTVNSDGLSIIGNRFFTLGTTAATTAIKIAGTMSRLRVNDNFVVKAVLNNTSCLIAHGALVMSSLEVARNRVFSNNTDSASGAFLITTSATTNTGMVYDNYVKGLDTAAEVLCTSGCAYGLFNNLYNGDANASGFVSPAIGSTS